MRRTLVTILIACGSSTNSGFDENGGGGSEDGGSSGILGNGQKEITSLTIDPPTAALIVESGGPAQTQQYKAIVHYADNGWPQTSLELDANNRNLSKGSIAEGDTSGLFKYVMSKGLPPTKVITGD